MTDVALEEGRASPKDVGEDGAKAELETKAPPSCSEPAGVWAKDHCDHLLDSIDAQLSQLQVSGAGVTGASTDGDTPPNASRAAELEGCRTEQDGSSWVEISPAQKEEYGWRLMYLLGCEQVPENVEDQSDLNSVCTEDFADRFREGMVDPLVISDGEGDVRAVACPARGSTEEGCATGIKMGLAGLLSSAEGIPLSAARGQEDTLERFKEELEGELPVALSSSVEGPQSVSSRIRRESLESLGGRISRLSQSKTMDSPGSADIGKASSTGSRVPGPAHPKRLELSEESISWPLQQGGKHLEGSSRYSQNLQENSPSFGSPLLMEELGPSQPLRALAARAWDGDSQLAGTAWSPSKRKQAECGLAWSESPCHYTPPVAHSSPSLASREEKSPWLMASLCTNQGPPPELEKSWELSLALQGYGATAQLAGTPKSVAAVTQDGGWEPSSQALVEPGDPKREALGLLLQESAILVGLAGRGVAHSAERGGGEGTWGSCEPQPGPVARGACGLTLYAPKISFDSDLDSVRPAMAQAHLCKATSHWRAPVYSPQGPCHTQRNSLGDLGSSGAVTDEDEEEEEGVLWSCGRGPVRCSSVPSMAESSLEGTRKDACMEHQDLGTDVERLLRRKSRLRQADLSLRDILGRKQYTVQELELRCGALERSQGAGTLESHVKETRRKADEARVDPLLEHKQESCLWELPELEKELSAQGPQPSTTHSSQLGTFQAEISLLAAKREELKAHAHHLEGSLSSLECQELERQLSCCKAELFSVQRVARARIEMLQECLEEAQRKLEERIAEGTALQEENTQLRQQLRELEKKQTAALRGQIRDLRARETEQELRLSALEQLLSEKELELVRLREAVCALTAEKEAQQRAVENVGDEYSRQLGKMRQEKELELARQKEELQHLKRQELQEFAESLEQSKAGALQDQAASFQKEIENLTTVIKAREEEVLQQQEATERLVRELKLEAQGKIIQGLEIHSRSLQREKQEALDELRVLLQAEKMEALRRLREELEQAEERACESDRLRARLRKLEEEQSLLQTEQNEMSLREQEAQSHVEWAERFLAWEISLACQRLQDLLPRRLMAHGGPSPRSTSHALELLHTVSEETQCHLRALQREMEAQKHTMLHLQEKEWELRQQQEQLHMESAEALEALKERLIQEHLQEITGLQCRQLKEAGDRVQQRPREKDNALQAVQSTMTHWKDGTTSKLTHKIEEELETRLSKDPPMDFHRSTERLDAEIWRLSTDWRECPRLCPPSSSSLSAIPTHGQRSFVPPELLHQLWAENTICRGGSLEDLAALRTEPGQTGREEAPNSISRSHRSMGRPKGRRVCAAVDHEAETVEEAYAVDRKRW